MNVRVLAAGLKVVEVPSYEARRIHGTSNLRHMARRLPRPAHDRRASGARSQGRGTRRAPRPRTASPTARRVEAVRRSAIGERVTAPSLPDRPPRPDAAAERLGRRLRLHRGAGRASCSRRSTRCRRRPMPPREVIVVVDHNPSCCALGPASTPPASLTIENERAVGPRRRAQQRRCAAARGDVVAFLDDDAVAAPTGSSGSPTAYRDPRVARRRRGRRCPPGRATARAGCPEEFHWVVGCSYRGLPREPARRSATSSAATCPSGARRRRARSAASHPASAASAARPLGCEETELCIRIGRHAPSRDAPLRPGRQRSAITCPRERATWRLLPVPLPRRGPLEGRGRAARGPRQRPGRASASTRRARCRRACGPSCVGASRTATRRGWRARRRSSPGSARPPTARRGRHGRR